MPSPPKPWEVNNTSNNGSTTITSPTTAASLTTSTAPEVPSRSTLTTDSTSLTRPTGYGTTTGYNSLGYGSNYGSHGLGSTYNRYGGYGSSYGNYGSSYGGYGGGYGGSYGGGYGGYGSHGGYGMNRYGGSYGRMIGPGGPDDMGLTQRMEMGTRPAFEVIENIVGSFGGFAQMLESTFMATHSSFMAMVGVAEQIGFLKNYLGQVFSIFALYRFTKKMVSKITGRGGNSLDLNVMDFENFEQKAAKAGSGPKMSRKPFIIFMLMVVGLPYMMHKLIKLITANQQKQMSLQGTTNNSLAGIDPTKLEFARATYDFTAESQMELNLKKGDIVAIISKIDSVTNTTGQWWRGRLRDGTMGLFPANYVEIIQKGGPAAAETNNNEDALKKEVPTIQQEITTKLV